MVKVTKVVGRKVIPVSHQTMQEALSATKNGQTLVANIKQQANEASDRIHKLFQLADFTFIHCDSVPNPAVGKMLVKASEANIRSIGTAGGLRYAEVVDALYFAHQSPKDWLEAKEAILHG